MSNDTKDYRSGPGAAGVEERRMLCQGYRKGYGKPRKLTTRVGTVEVRRPRVRGLSKGEF